MSTLGMKKDRRIQVGTLLLSPDELSEAKDYIYDEYSVVVEVWSRERLDKEIENYWINKGKTEEEDE